MKSSREVIIIVDDDVTNLTAGKSTLSEKYDVFTTSSGQKLFSLLEKLTPDLILLDIRMPGMDGYEIISKLKASSLTEHIPVIFLTSRHDPSSEVKGLDLGAVDYITKPFSRELLLKRVDLHVLFEKQRVELLKHNSNLEVEVDKKSKTVIELQNTILRTVAELVECRDNITGGHIERTEHYLRLLIDFLLAHDVYTEQISQWDIDLLVMSSQLHDVGKISIKDSILMKPGKLTDDEFHEMKKHTQYGVDIIRKIEEGTSENEFLKYAEVMAETHHERWDGMGYPHGLAKENIPLPGRLMAIIDVYDALTNDRPYKRAFSHDVAIDIISAGRGTQFDPAVCDIFIEHEGEFKDIDLSGSSSSSLPSNLTPAIAAVTSESGKKSGYVARMSRYLEIFFDALLEHESYSGIVSTWDKDLFIISAQLHDIGDITVADYILKKADELTKKEFENIESHVEFGLKIIRELKESVEDKSMLYHAEMLVGTHHEKWDGTGYPLGIKDFKIPLQGRIMAIVDVYDALTTDRSHRSKVTHDEAVEAIKNGSGIQFDPGLVEVFVRLNDEFKI